VNKLAAMATFVRIVEKGSLTAAAAALDTSLPSVVRTLAALEADLGVRLLNRTTRRIHLTDEGAQYLERCRAILAAVQDTEAAFSERRVEPQGRLSVTASVLFGRRYIAPIANAFVRRHPKVSAELVFVDRVVNQVEEGVDVAVRIGHLRDSSLVAVPVGRVRRVVCASPEYLRRRGTPRMPDDVRRHDCVRHTGLAPRAEWQFRLGRRIVAERIVQQVIENFPVQGRLGAVVDIKQAERRSLRLIAIAHPQRHFAQLGRLIGQQVRLQVEHDLQPVLDLAQEAIRPVEDLEFLVGQAADFFQGLHGQQGVALAHLRQVAAVQELQ